MNNYRSGSIGTIVLLLTLLGNGLSMSPYERLMKRDAPQGLYGPADHVTVLTNTNFNEVVFDRPVSSFVEFYNSYCGACQRFSPSWKNLAKNVTKWGTFVQVCALDCATDENNDVCRQYEIMRYPTIRYFPPKYSRGDKQLGTNLDHLLIPKESALMNELVMLLQNETNGGPNWPKFEKFDGDEWKEIFNTIPSIIRFVYVISDELPETIAQQTLLDYSSRDKITTRIVNTNNLKLFRDSSSSFRLGVVEQKTGTFQSLSIQNESREALSFAIDDHIKNNHISLVSTESSIIETASEDSVGTLLDRFYYDKARALSPMPLFRADLEQAIRYSLGHEVTQHQVIAGEYLSTLRSFVSVLTRYYNFGNKNSYKKLLDFLMEPSRTEVRGDELQTFLNKLNPPIIHDSRYVGCFSTKPGLRRFPCTLWTLFHHLTVQHLDSDLKDADQDPLEVLHAMHGYIKHFFGCTECSKHFQDMAKRNHIWNVTSRDQAVLWLWSSHNEVNKRLHDDLTEDENHPKIQYPAEEHCHVCHKKNGIKEWDKTEVLEFLRRHYGNDHVSDLGYYESLPNAKLFNARARQIFAGDAHLHIGVLAYVVIIICLMIVAVRFYFRRGYRKKLYPHDILGKV